MKKTIILTFFCFSLSLTNVMSKQNPNQIQLPEFADSITWNTSKKAEITDFTANHKTAALLIFHKGNKVFEYGDIDKPFNIFSIRKSITSVLYGIYISKGYIESTQTLEELGIDDKLGLTAQEKQARIIDLLRVRSGVYHPAAYETPGMQNNRPERNQFKRDENWYYNNWDFNALTGIFEQLTAISIFQAFEEHISVPLNMEDFDPSLQKYHYEKDVSEFPAAVWQLSANDLSLFGRLLLNNGKWKGNQLIPMNWVTESTTPYSDLGILGGYGYSWWAAKDGLHYPFVNLPEGTFSARGTGEQNLVVIPKWDMVIVHLTEVNSPKDQVMKVTEFGKLLMIISEQSLF